MNSPKLTERMAKASMARGNIAAAMLSGVVQTSPTPAAINPPAAVPRMRSIARV